MKSVCAVLLCVATLASTASTQTDSLRAKIRNIAGAHRAAISVAIQGAESTDTLFVNADRHCPMQSVYKFHLALTVLHLVDQGSLKLDQKVHVTKGDLLPHTWSPLREKYPDGNVDVPLEEIIRFTVGQSDNNGCDILFRLIGGTEVANAYMHSLGITDIAIAATEAEMHSGWDVQYRNWTTPRATVKLLAAFDTGKILSPGSRDLLWKFMVDTETGPKRLKGMLEKGVTVAHKTGSSGSNEGGLVAATNDIGIIVLPNGRHLIVVVYVSDSKEPEETGEAVIAGIAKAVWDHYNTHDAPH